MIYFLSLRFIVIVEILSGFEEIWVLFYSDVLINSLLCAVSFYFTQIEIKQYLWCIWLRSQVQVVLLPLWIS